MRARRLNMSQMAFSLGEGTLEPVMLAIRGDRADCIHLVNTHGTRKRPNGRNWNACPWKTNHRECVLWSNGDMEKEKKKKTHHADPPTLNQSCDWMAHKS